MRPRQPKGQNWRNFNSPLIRPAHEEPGSHEGWDNIKKLGLATTEGVEDGSVVGVGHDPLPIRGERIRRDPRLLW